VLVQEDHAKRASWKIGIVEEVIRGKDGEIRGAKVRKAGKAAALLKKNKLKGIDSDSPGVSSEESGSVCSNSSNYSLDSLPPHDAPSTCKNVSDEEYMRMDYNPGEATVSRNSICTDQQSNFMLITPDNLKAGSEVGDIDDTYMSMKDGNSYDDEVIQHGFEKEATIKRRSQQHIKTSSRSSWSSNEGGVFSSGASDSQLPIKSRPVPLPPRTRKPELDNPNTKNNTIFTSVVDDNPIPLPPKTSRQFSNQSAASDEERTGRLSPRTRRIVDYNVITSNDLEEPPPRCYRPKDTPQIGIDKRAPVANKYEEVGPFDMDKRDLPPLPAKENSPIAPRRDRIDLATLYATVDKETRNASKQSPVPVVYQRELSKQSVQSDGDISPISVRRLFSPQAPDTKRELRSFSEMSLSEYEEISPAGTTGRKPRTLWKELGKRVTMNFKQDRKTKRSPKLRPNGRTSQFYVDVRKEENQTEGQDGRNDQNIISPNGINEQFRRPAQLPVRPNFLDLTNTQSARYETVALGCGNICSPADEKADDDDNIDPSNMRKYPEAGRNLYGTRPNQVISDTSAFSKHIQQQRTGRALNYETVYTEIELKDKDSSIMPRKGFLTLTKDKKSKAKGTSDAEEKIARRQSNDSDEDTEVFQRKPSQKILSSPTKDGKGFESISLRDEVITTPLDEIEGRPYMNLGFHKNKGKSVAEKRRSADDAAIKQLMNLQSDKKIGDELSARRKNNADAFVRKYSVEENDENDEVSYVNVGKDGKLVDKTGCDITPANVRHRRASEQRNGEGSNYQNIGISTNAKKIQGFDNPTVSTADALTTRDSAPVKQESNNEHLYSNIGFGSSHEKQSNVKRERPQPAPRTKKPERRKISQSTKEGRKISEGSVSADITERGFSPPHGHMANVAAHTNVLADFGISEASYVNVGSGGYHDGFDAGGPSVPHHVPPKGQNYVNVVQEDFQPRRQRKKSAEWDLAYADVMVIKGKEQTVDPSSGREGSSPDGSENNSPRANVKDVSRSRCAYTEIDFKRSQGISEAVRERRVESFDESYAD